MSKSFEEKDLFVIICEAINLNEDNDRIIELIDKLDPKSLIMIHMGMKQYYLRLLKSTI